MVDNIFMPQPIQPVGPPGSTGSNSEAKAPATSFEEILAQKTLKFSRHASEMIAKRSINITADRMGRITDAVEKATAKGARDSLILVDDLALVVSVKNRTVITAIDGPSIKGNVFTNIDSAVIA
ncbi:MAG: TIGR02530 family flagellar biosynthesis protein [Thermacetogeniaceae bacterium]